MRILGPAVLLIAASIPALAQWEIGALGGYSAYRKQLTVETRTGETASLGFQPGFAVGVYGGLNEYEYLSGEARYVYHESGSELEFGGTKVTAPGHAHVVQFDVLVHAANRRAAVRPYLSIGGGLMVVEGTGVDRAAQPLSRFAILTRTRDVKPLASPGAGVKWRISEHVSLRTEVKYYFSPVPDRVLAPSPGSRLTGWMHQLIPFVGIAATF